MVRLKGMRSARACRRSPQFQFLMVRLKGPASHAGDNQRYHISIPYGAIKRRCRSASSSASVIFQFLMVRLKADNASKDIELKQSFQFLMVRLKDSWSLALWPINVISIPYGAIKRWWSTWWDEDTDEISIPYGAIKSFVAVKNGMINSNFNSLWCD